MVDPENKFAGINKDIAVSETLKASRKLDTEAQKK